MSLCGVNPLTYMITKISPGGPVGVKKSSLGAILIISDNIKYHKYQVSRDNW